MQLSDEERLHRNNLTKMEYKFNKLNHKQKVRALLSLLSCDDELEFLDVCRDDHIQNALEEVGFELSTYQLFDDVNENRLYRYWKLLNEETQLDLIFKSLGEDNLHETLDSYFEDFYEMFDLDNDQEIRLNYYCGDIIHLEDAKGEILGNATHVVMKIKIDDYLKDKGVNSLDDLSPDDIEELMFATQML